MIEGRGRWAILAVMTTLIVFGGIQAFYTGYAIDKNNKKIEEGQVQNNQLWCGLLREILITGRESPFKVRIQKIYDDPRYRCRDVEPL